MLYTGVSRFPLSPARGVSAASAIEGEAAASPSKEGWPCLHQVNISLQP